MVCHKGRKVCRQKPLRILRTIFTRNDPFGNVANILDALQEAINQRIGIRFGYRSGTKGKYQNPFRVRDVAIYGWEVSPLSASNRPTLNVLGYDQAVIRNNIRSLLKRDTSRSPVNLCGNLRIRPGRSIRSRRTNQSRGP